MPGSVPCDRGVLGRHGAGAQRLRSWHSARSEHQPARHGRERGVGGPQIVGRAETVLKLLVGDQHVVVCVGARTREALGTAANLPGRCVARRQPQCLGAGAGADQHEEASPVDAEDRPDRSENYPAQRRSDVHRVEVAPPQHEHVPRDGDSGDVNESVGGKPGVVDVDSGAANCPSHQSATVMSASCAASDVLLVGPVPSSAKNWNAEVRVGAGV